MLQGGPETVAAEPADRIGDAQAAVEPTADLDQYGVGCFIAENVVDHRHVVDADRQKGGRTAGALIDCDDLVDRLAQPALVEMARQLVEIRKPFEARLLRLAIANSADHAEHELWPTGVVPSRSAALLHPDKAARGITQAILAVEQALAVEMLRKRQLPLAQIVGMDAAREAASRRQLGRKVEFRGGKAPQPLHSIAIEFPGIGDIACRLESSRETDCRLVFAQEHRLQPQWNS